MHPVHIPHLNALLYGLSRNASSEEGLDANNRFYVPLEHLLHLVVRKDAVRLLLQI